MKNVRALRLAAQASGLAKSHPTFRFPGLGLPDDRRETPIVSTQQQLKNKAHALANGIMVGEQWNPRDAGFLPIKPVDPNTPPEETWAEWRGESGKPLRDIMRHKLVAFHTQAAGMASGGGRSTSYSKGRELRGPSWTRNPADGHLSPGATQLHEDLHLMMGRVEKKYGLQGRINLGLNLLEHLKRKDPRAFLALKAFDASRNAGQDPRSVHRHEETLAVLMNYLNNPRERNLFHRHQTRMPETMSRVFDSDMKRAHRVLWDAAQKVTPMWVLQGPVTKSEDWEQWKKDQEKYSTSDKVWQDYMREIGTETVHGIKNPAAEIELGRAALIYDHLSPKVAEAHRQNRSQAMQFGFDFPVEPAYFTSNHFDGDVGIEFRFWQDVAKRSPLLRRSRNKLVHKAEAPVAIPSAPVESSNHYRRLSVPYGNISAPGMSGPATKHYPLEGRGPAVDKLIRDHGYAPYYVGGKYGKPDLAKKNYSNGYLPIHASDSGDFKEHGYIDTWRKSHELAHALTRNEVNKIYGEGGRSGGLGQRTLNEAMRAVHWEWLAAHKQRELLSSIGVNVPDETFHKELNTVMHDAVYRAVTGNLIDPEMGRFVPHGHKIPLSISLDQLREEAQRMGLSKADPWKSNAELVAHLNTKGDVHGVMRDALLDSGYQENRHNVKDPKLNPGYNPGGLDAWDRTLAANDANRITGTNASEPSGAPSNSRGAHRFSPGLRDTHYWEDVERDPSPYSDSQLETLSPEERSPIMRRRQGLGEMNWNRDRAAATAAGRVGVPVNPRKP